MKLPSPKNKSYETNDKHTWSFQTARYRLSPRPTPLPQYTPPAEASADRLPFWLCHTTAAVTVSNNNNFKKKVHATYTSSRKPVWPLSLCFHATVLRGMRPNRESPAHYLETLTLPSPTWLCAPQVAMVSFLTQAL